jgi:hypothetical protein
VRHDEFTGQVQSRARLAGRGDAERAACAVLETLGERVPEGLAGNLTAQLPHEIGEHLRRTEVYGGAGIGDRFGRQDFIARVAERAGAGRLPRPGRRRGRPGRPGGQGGREPAREYPPAHHGRKHQLTARRGQPAPCPDRRLQHAHREPTRETVCTPPGGRRSPHRRVRRPRRLLRGASRGNSPPSAPFTTAPPAPGSCGPALVATGTAR